MIETTHQEHYLHAVLDEFRADAATLTGFELKKKLWHACVVVLEVTGTQTRAYEDWHLTLSDIAMKAGIRPSDIIRTVQSARARKGAA